MQAALFVFLCAISALAVPAPRDNAVVGHHTCFVRKYEDLPGCIASGKGRIWLEGPITVPANQVMDMKLKPKTHVILSGTITFAKGNLKGNGPALLTIQGTDITFTSDPNNPGVLDGQGQLYWDGLGGNGGVPKPRMFGIYTNGQSLFHGFTLRNTPVESMSVDGSGITIDSVRIDNSLGDSKGGHNTDAFDVIGDGIVIKNSWVHNQDDCLAINAASGAGVQFINNTCIGGHGISIATYSTGVVENVLVKDCVVKDSYNGIRIKTQYQSQGGRVSNVVYENLHFDNVGHFGVAIQQDYLNGGPTGKPISKTLISNIKVINVKGSVQNGAKSTYILCAPAMCNGFHFEGVHIGPKAAACSGIHPAPLAC
ncbi:glycoside hydrolase [Chytriomyces sp. MP71]|nr:glycoside hydrolase [Chytriomyces sp. MP71]